jgi:hypothetical protein
MKALECISQMKMICHASLWKSKHFNKNGFKAHSDSLLFRINKQKIRIFFRYLYVIFT